MVKINMLVLHSTETDVGQEKEEMEKVGNVVLLPPDLLQPKYKQNNSDNLLTDMC